MNIDPTLAATSLYPSKRGQVEPFRAMEVVARAAELSREGRDIISLCLGQPGAPAPASAREAAQKAIAAGQIGYTPSPGIFSLRDRISRYYREKHEIVVDPSRIIVTGGSSAGFVLAFLAGFEPGQRIAVPTPGYPAYRNILRALSLEPVEIATTAEDRWAISEERLIDVHRRTPLAGILIANPNNPNGTMVNPEVFKQLVETARDHRIRFISDEIYHGLTYEFPEITAAALDPNAFVINSFSKYFCMTGWRIGWMIVPESMVVAVDRLQQNAYICASEISQIAAQAAFDDLEDLDRLRAGYQQNRALIMDRLPRLGLSEIQPVDGAFYAYARSTGIGPDSSQLAREMLEQCGVAVTPGVDFDSGRGLDWLRFSFCGEKNRLAEALDRIENWIGDRTV